MGCLVNIVYLEDWIDPEAAIEGNDVDPDQIGKGEGGCDRHLLYSFQEEQHTKICCYQ